MSSEIVPADPIQERVDGGEQHERMGTFTRSLTYGSDYVPKLFDSERLPVTLGSEIRKLLRVANQLEFEEPRVAYLCRFHAFEKAHIMDRHSSGRGVRQFKTALLQRLERDMQNTLMKRKEKSDMRELKRVCKEYGDYTERHTKQDDFANREKLRNARTIASVLFDVLNTVSSAAGHQQVLADRDTYYKKTESDVYNILPLDHGGTHQAIMKLPQIKIAVAAIRDTCGLPFLEDFQKRRNALDVFDWLQFCFGFQTGNVANQREHLILLLANFRVEQCQRQAYVPQLLDGAVNGLMRKFFKNYTNWCKFLGRKSNIRLPYIKQEAQQHKILYLGLYLLIWGEAANLRFMPECLCYIYHHMADELHSMLTGAVSLLTWEKVMPAYGGKPESFLDNVVTPIYTVISEEAKKNKNGTADHSIWRNYDDLNEYFWSPECFEIGWPMRKDHDFFSDGKSSQSNCALNTQNFQERHEQRGMRSNEEKREDKAWLGKTKFVEIRSFWLIFWSFDRMWIYFILALQALIIIACHNLGSPLQLFEARIIEDIMSIFITSAVIELIRAIVGIALTWKARHTMDFIHILKYALKLIVAVIWTIVLPVCYAYTRRKYTCYGAQSGRWLGQWCYSSYMIAVAVYLMPNAVNMVLFLVPVAGRYIETSNCKICVIFSWWTQSRLYVGRGMQEDQVSVFKYTIFWFLLLLSKLSFSYYLEIKPLIEPTKQIMRIGVERYEWHELLPGVKSNAGAVVAVWAPIILVYFMDTQIWYSVFCTIFGGVYGILHHLGEIRTLGMLRSRFHSLPAAFNACLNPPSFRNGGERGSKYNFLHRFKKVPGNEKNDVRKFAIVWNHIINTFRSEDLISNREMDLMLFLLSSEIFSGQVRWPIFLLANKFSIALSIAKDFAGTDEYLLRKITKDFHMNCAVKECYESLKYILGIIIVGDVEKRILSGIIDEIEESILRSTLLEDICMSELPSLQAKCIELVELLLERNAHLKKAKVEGNACLEKEKVEGNARLEKEKVEENASHSKVVKVLQDIFELVTINMMANGSRTLDMLYSADLIEENIQPELFATNGSIQLPPEENGPLYDQIKRFHLLLTVEDTAMDIPANLDARRRISFFATSLFMNMPVAPKVQNMLSFSVLTPHYTEEVKFSMSELLSGQEQVSIIFYMQMIYPDEWKNFLERAEVKNLEALISEKKENELRDWTSFRGQTLSRTVRGMMYYREALKLQAFLDMAKDEDIQQGYEATSRRNTELPAILDALADMKFSYVVTCQTFGAQKASGDPRAQDIIDLMNRYPSLRLAYVEEKEVVASKEHPPVYSSVLVKGVNGYDQEIYRIKLPGTPNIGEGKPENQNHAIIFTRGEALQAIDMNQDNYFEEAFKMRNLLQEFHKGRPSPTILGLREHIFTGSVSSLAWFMSYQEKSFVTIGQRLLANLLRVRFHYGHSDLFDRVFHMTRGGISKASKTINLSEDVFAGFNSTLRRGYITYHEYMQVGKGRDVGLNQISKFEAKVANGNSEQTLSRDVHRLGCRFDFFRMLSFYFTTVGFYFNSLTSVIAVYVFLYGQLYLVLSGLQKALILEAKVHNIRSLETALASQSFIQLGLLTGLPMVMEIGLEKGFMIALQDFILMQFQLAAVFFTFSFGTKSHYYGRTILHGGAKYRPTGRKVVIFHASFTENYRLYSRSHFVKGFELILLLIVYDMFRKSYQSNVAYVLITYAMWFLSMSWLFAPFLFNPSGFNWQKIVEDWTDWDKWIRHQGGIGIHQDKSWESWWDDEQAHLRRAGLSSRLFEMLLSLRFFLYQYGLVYHLDISQQSKNFIVYVLSWIVIAVVFLLAKVVGIGRQFLSADHQFAYRLFKAIIFIAVLLTIITLSVICQLSLMDVVVCCLAFFPTGWGLLLVAQAVRPMIQNTGIWDFMQILARAYDYGMGVVLFFPIASLAWLPIISAFQTRFLFNPALKRQLQIQTILAGKKKNA